MTAPIDIADALVTRLGAASLPMAIGTIERRWLPDWEIADVAALRIGVIPKAIDERIRLTRTDDQFAPVVDIAIMRHIGAGAANRANAVVDPYVLMAQAVAANIAGISVLTGVANVRLVTMRHEPLIDQQRLLEHGVFFSLISTVWLATEAVR